MLNRLIRRIAQHYCGHNQRDLERTVHNIAAGARRARLDAEKADRKRKRGQRLA